MSERDGNDAEEGPSPEGDSTARLSGENGSEVSLIVRILAIIVVLAAGVGMFMGLSLLKKPPAGAVVSERSISVEVMAAVPENVPVTVTGLGEVRALKVVPISPEVPGVVVETHPRLDMGEIVAEGELLFRIDPRDYAAARQQAKAQLEQLTKTIERLERQFAIDQSRLSTLARSEALMQSQFERTRDLFEQDDVGTRSAVDQAEMALNQASDARDQLGQAIALYPVQIQEARSGLDGARAQLTLAEANLARTEVRAPFEARIKEVSLEKGQFVSPGAHVLTLADDRVLEISVSLDSRDARNWLQFEESPPQGASAWFGRLKPLPCEVAWTEDPDHHRWEGEVHRIETFDQRNRTVSVAVRILGENAQRSTGGLPLVEGMFCKVSIPGNTIEQVYRLPRWAVTYEGTVYVIRGGRLAIQSVDVVRSEGEETFVRGGIDPGEQVITTRLVNPLPNTLVRINGHGDGGA